MFPLTFSTSTSSYFDECLTRCLHHTVLAHSPLAQPNHGVLTLTRSQSWLAAFFHPGGPHLSALNLLFIHFRDPPSTSPLFMCSLVVNIPRAIFSALLDRRLSLIQAQCKCRSPVHILATKDMLFCALGTAQGQGNIRLQSALSHLSLHRGHSLCTSRDRVGELPK